MITSNWMCVAEAVALAKPNEFRYKLGGRSAIAVFCRVLSLIFEMSIRDAMPSPFELRFFPARLIKQKEPIYRQIMNKAMALVFLFGGIFLLMVGYNEAHSVRSGLSHWLTGSPSDKSEWMLIAGGIATLAGVISLLFNSK